MFSIQVQTLDKTVLLAFSRMFVDMANSAPTTMTGTEYIASLDIPDAGAEQVASAAAVFTAGVITNAPQPGTPAAVFGGSPFPNVAPFTAGVGQQGIAHGGTPGTSAPSAPPPPAPTSGNAGVTAAPPAPHAHPALLDSNGLPWDVRIHAGTRTTTAKGAWKAKKGVDDATVASVTAQLRAGMSPPPSATPFTPINAAPPVPLATPAPPPPVTPSISVTPVSPSEITEFIPLCVYVTQTRRFSPDVIAAVCQQHGLDGLAMAQSRLDLIPSMYATFAAIQ